MRHFILIFIFLLLVQMAYAQSNDRWSAFWNEDSELMGFKDSKGQVMIEPRFMGFTMAKEFDNIIAVMENNNGSYESYYLCKSGRKVGRDSLYIFDNGADCENEGFIRFRDIISDKVGIFDKNGNIVVPAIYDDLSRVHNGLILALKGASKKYFDDHKESGCNHFTWKGGKEVLLSIENQVLLDNFKYEREIDFYSLELTEYPTEDENKISFIGLNGNYYTFIDREKDFRLWLINDFLKNPSKENFMDHSMDSVIFWKEEWISESKTEFIEHNFELMALRMNSILDSKSDHFVSNDGLNPFIYRHNNYKDYFNTCGEALREKYTVMALIINNTTNSNYVQDHFEFLKTDKGYKLISVTIRSEK